VPVSISLYSATDRLVASLFVVIAKWRLFSVEIIAFCKHFIQSSRSSNGFWLRHF